jgi:hypothetical protein
MNPIEIIQVIPTAYTQTIAAVEISAISFATQNSLAISVILRDSSQVFIKNTSLTMSGADFAGWQNNNTYLQNWVLTQLGLTSQNELIGHYDIVDDYGAK